MSKHSVMVECMSEDALKGIIESLSRQTWLNEWAERRIEAANKELQRRRRHRRNAAV